MNSKYHGDYEVEKIINHKTENDTRYFEVKLKNSNQCVWIPLISSRRILNENSIMEYYIRHNVKLKSLPPISRLKRADELFKLLSKVTEDELNWFVRRYHNFNLPPSNMGALEDELLRSVPDDDEIRLEKSHIMSLRDKVLIEICHEKRKRQLAVLQEKEWWLNLMSDNAEPILIQNNVDFATLPELFKYVNNYVAGHGVRIETSPPDDFGCGSHSTSDRKHVCGKNCICVEIFDAKPAYDRNGQVILGRGERIHECNKKCRCDDNCRFRVIQKGCKIPLLIFRCSNGAGWGVKTLEFIPKGTYVGRYVGKVILWEEAESLTTSDGRNHYLFDIDFIKVDKGRSKYTVDAFEYGNFTRFINHSCAPNLVVHHAWINTLDDNLHDLAFFAMRSIECGEELTFNYRKVFHDCKCGSYKCIQKGSS